MPRSRTAPVFPTASSGCGRRTGWPTSRARTSPGDAEGGCPFCRIPALPDDEGLIVARGELVYAVLNLYPYNSGHLMVLPYRHVADYTELDVPETAEMADSPSGRCRAAHA